MMGFGGKQEGKELDEIGGGGGGEGGERVHVFSLATGHLYERLMKVRGVSRGWRRFTGLKHEERGKKRGGGE